MPHVCVCVFDYNGPFYSMLMEFVLWVILSICFASHVHFYAYCESWAL